MLSNVLVLIAPHGNIPTDTLQSLLKLQAARAVIQNGGSQTDVTLTRCVQAGTAFKILKERQSIEWVFWLDHDMVCEPESVYRLVEYSKILHKELNRLSTIDYRLSSYPSLSGIYINRHRQVPSVAAWKLKNEDVITLNSTIEREPKATESTIDHRFVPALTGMGCLLQHRNAFMAHCDESIQFNYPLYGNLLPQVCESRLASQAEFAPYVDIHDDVKALYWMNEDFSYTLREIKNGRRVFIAPVPFGHISKTILWPDEKTVFPGLSARSPVTGNRLLYTEASHA